MLAIICYLSAWLMLGMFISGGKFELVSYIDDGLFEIAPILKCLGASIRLRISNST